MRPTQLNFRSPQERTAEYKQYRMNCNGNDLNFLQKTMNTSGTTLPKERRFKDKPLYDKGTGQTCYLGPGSYNDHENFKNMTKQSCPSKIVSLNPSNLELQCFLTARCFHSLRCLSLRCLSVSQVSSATS